MFQTDPRTYTYQNTKYQNIVVRGRLAGQGEPKIWLLGNHLRGPDVSQTSQWPEQPFRVSPTTSTTSTTSTCSSSVSRGISSGFKREAEKEEKEALEHQVARDLETQ